MVEHKLMLVVRNNIQVGMDDSLKKNTVIHALSLKLNLDLTIFLDRTHYLPTFISIYLCRSKLIYRGAEIVERGRNVTNCILPESGTKEASPTGSWLEAKQIQTALEKRKSLVAAERIDKV